MRLSLLISPEWNTREETVSTLEIRWNAEGLKVRAGDKLAAWVLELVGIPFCPLESLTIEDDLGEIPLRFEDGEAEMSFIHRRFAVAERDTSGSIRTSWRITPRVQPAGYRSSPYFDLVAERGGVLGAGATFLVHPAIGWDDPLDIELTWDLTELGESGRGVWTYGEGHVERTLDLNRLLFSAYMAGEVRSVEEGHAGFYWFDELPLDPQEVSRQINLLFDHMAEMFHDSDECYRVFARHNVFPGGGGTAFPRSYIYGYGKDDQVDLDDLRDLLAHEMTHNWPTMRDEPPGLGTWYVEGSAEYYATIVPMEMGLCSLEHTAQVINEKAGSYFSNPMMSLSNEELGKRYWQDRRCQRVPYARGILFLSNTDAQIRRATDGKRTLLDVEIRLLEQSDVTPDDFLAAVRDIAGLDLREAYEQMCAGGACPALIPDPDAFGGRFDVTPCIVQINDSQHTNEKILLDETVDGYVWSVKRNA